MTGANQRAALISDAEDIVVTQTALLCRIGRCRADPLAGSRSAVGRHSRVRGQGGVVKSTDQLRLIRTPCLDRFASRFGEHKNGAILPMTESPTAKLLSECQGGSLRARDRLVRRFLPKMKRWAHGRLPQYARSISVTEDLVQNTFLRALDNVGTFEAKREGAFLAYLRQIFVNQLRDEIRRHACRPTTEAMKVEPMDEHRSLLEMAIGFEALERYDSALKTLAETDQQAVVMRLEFGYEFAEIAADLELPSANAARMRVTRAISRLAELIDREDLRP